MATLARHSGGFHCFRRLHARSRTSKQNTPRHGSSSRRPLRFQVLGFGTLASDMAVPVVTDTVQKYLLVSSDFSLFTADRVGGVVVVVVRGIIGVDDRVVRSSDSVGDGE